LDRRNVMKIAMPSPRGTNFAALYFPAGATGWRPRWAKTGLPRCKKKSKESRA
jgi:hypothetical protein